MISNWQHIILGILFTSPFVFLILFMNTLSSQRKEDDKLSKEDDRLKKEFNEEMKKYYPDWNKH